MFLRVSFRVSVPSNDTGMERRTFIIGAVAGGIGLLEYGFVSRYMNSLHAPRGASVKAYKRYGEQAALVAITPNDDFYVTSKGHNAVSRRLQVAAES